MRDIEQRRESNTQEAVAFMPHHKEDCGRLKNEEPHKKRAPIFEKRKRG